MKKDEEKTASGQPIYRYGEAHNAFNEAKGNEKNMALVLNHIERYFGEIEGSFQEVVSDQVHLDIHWVKPSKKYNFHLLISSGMSDQPMNVPKGSEQWQFAELCILLPPDWPMPENMTQEWMQAAFSDELIYWPIRWLKMIARLPHYYNSWVGYGHTIPNGEDAEAFAETTDLGCMLILNSIDLPEEFVILQRDEITETHFYTLVPIFKEEMNCKLNEGTNTLLDKFEEQGIRTVFDLKRKNVCR